MYLITGIVSLLNLLMGLILNIDLNVPNQPNIDSGEQDFSCKLSEI